MPERLACTTKRALYRYTLSLSVALQLKVYWRAYTSFFSERVTYVWNKFSENVNFCFCVQTQLTCWFFRFPQTVLNSPSISVMPALLSRSLASFTHRWCPVSICLSVCLFVCLSVAKMPKTQIFQKLSNLELWCLLTTYRKLCKHNWAFQRTH